jgi:hypothetical protein
MTITTPTAVEPGPFLWLVAAVPGLLALVAAAGVAVGRTRAGRRPGAPTGG